MENNGTPLHPENPITVLSDVREIVCAHQYGHAVPPPLFGKMSPEELNGSRVEMIRRFIKQ